MGRRMFSPNITSTDIFLDMPVSARELYFQFGMNADDDGFIGNPKRIMRMTGASDDDFKVLVAKNFVIPFQSGVIVITAWKINNLVRKDWYRETIYLEEKAYLSTDKKGKYILSDKPVNELLTNSLTQDRIGKDRIGKDRIEREIEYLSKIPETDLEEFIKKFNITEAQIKDKAEDLINYCQSHGKRYKNYKAFLLNALKKDFGVKITKTSEKYKGL